MLNTEAEAAVAHKRNPERYSLGFGVFALGLKPRPVCRRRSETPSGPSSDMPESGLGFRVFGERRLQLVVLTVLGWLNQQLSFSFGMCRYFFTLTFHPGSFGRWGALIWVRRAQGPEVWSVWILFPTTGMILA